KCLDDWSATFAASHSSAAGKDDTLITELIQELYAHIHERRPTDEEVSENRQQFKLHTAKLDRQKAIGKLIESMLLSTEFAY
ncbi:MAG: hypothetical protein ACPHF4_15375, partial [Rubripirellula sp.]